MSVARINARIEELARQIAALHRDLAEVSSDPASTTVSPAAAALDQLQAAQEDLARDARVHHRRALIAAAVQDGVFEWNLETSGIFYSTGFQALLGYEDGELAADFEEWRARIHPDDYAAQLPALRAHIEGRTPLFRCEHRVRHRDGSYRWVLTRARLITDGEGTPHHFVGSLTDITDRKRAQEAALERAAAALEASEERYRTLYDETPSMYFTIAADGTVLSVNRFGAEQLGFSAQELVGISLLVIVHPDDHESVRRQLAACMQEPQRVAQWEIRHICRDGRVRWVRQLARSIRDHDQRPILLLVSDDVTAHRQTVEALQHTEERFALARQGANDVLWDWDLRQNAFFMSPRRNELLGTDEGERTDFRQWLERVHPHDAVPLGEAMRAHVLGQTPYFEFEYRLRKQDGTYLWVLARGLCQRDTDGNPCRLAGSLTDISPRKEAEEQLRRGEEYFRSLIEHCSDLITVSDQPGTFRYASPSVGRVLGFRPEDLIGRSIFDFIHPEDAEHIRRARNEALRTPGTVRAVQLRMRHFTGGWRDIEAYGRSVEQSPGNVVIVLNARDVTAHKEAERALRENEARFRTLAETVAAATFIYQGPRLVYVNSAAEQITGFSRDELIQMDFWDVIHSDHRALVRQRGLARQEGLSPPPHYEVKISTKDGSERWVDFTASLIDYDGQPAVLGTAFDVTERRRAQEEARLHQLELAHVARLTTLGEMAAGLAHELNQPLAAIVNYARGCARRLELGQLETPALVDIVNRISTQAKRASEILSGVRHFVRKDKPRRDWINLNDVVREAARLAELDAERHQVTVQLSLALDLPLINVNSIQIEQVIINLIANGIEAMERCPPQRILLLTTKAHDDAVELAVRDAGTGVPVELVDKVFDAFFSTKPSGLGLGLSISRTIIESHGGRLWGSANDERGTTFSFSLPTTPDLPSTVEAHSGAGQVR